MKFNQIGGVIKKGLKDHGSVIFSVSAGLGVAATSYLVGKASFKAANEIRDEEDKRGAKLDMSEKVRITWKGYIPPAVTAATTIGCIFGVHKVGSNKVLAAQTALSLTQSAYSDYREKVIEEFSARKDQTIKDRVVEDKVKKNPPPGPDVIVANPGSVLCCELYTGRYFTSDMETLRKARNELNSKLLKHDYATLDDLYYILGLKQTTVSGQSGWKSEKLMELEFTTVLTEDGRPCLAFDYNYVEGL